MALVSRWTGAAVEKLPYSFHHGKDDYGLNMKVNFSKNIPHESPKPGICQTSGLIHFTHRLFVSQTNDPRGVNTAVVITAVLDCSAACPIASCQLWMNNPDSIDKLLRKHSLIKILVPHHFEG